MAQSSGAKQWNFDAELSKAKCRKSSNHSYKTLFELVKLLEFEQFKWSNLSDLKLLRDSECHLFESK